MLFRSSAGDYNLTISDFQQMWEVAAKESLRVCDALGKMYGVQGCTGTVDPEEALVIQWGNGILYDEDKTNQEMLAQVQAGLLKPERYLAWYYDLPNKTAEDLQKIRQDYMPEMEAMLGGE